MPALLTLLADDLLGALRREPDGVARRVLLWLDPAREFARLAPHLAPALEPHGARLLSFAPADGAGQLGLKLDLLRMASAGQDARVAVVYLPGYGPDALDPQPGGGPPDLWALCEYRYTGCAWGTGGRREAGVVPAPPRLHEWLRAHGLAFPDDRGRTVRELAQGGADSLLARFAEQRRETDPATWPRPLRADDVRNALAGDPRTVLRELLAAPVNAARGWSDPALVLERLVAEYGFGLPDPLPRDAQGHVDGPVLADEFALQLALTEAWDAFGRPDDYPFRDRLSRHAEQRARQVAFVRDEVLPHMRLGPEFLLRVGRREPTYRLEGWAAGRRGEPAALPLLAGARWRSTLAEFDAAADAGMSSACRWLAERVADLEAGARGPWDGRGVSRWGPLGRLAWLCSASAEARDEIGAARTVADLVTGYSAWWWRLDATHLEIRDACLAEPGLERVRAIADRALFGYAAAAADAFAAAVERAGAWPPEGLGSAERLREAVWIPGARGRRAVIVSDALRWDLAERVRERLEGTGRSITLDLALSTVPSITPFGMTVLLPFGRIPPEQRALSVAYEPRPTIRDGAGRALSTRDGRKALLEAAFPPVRGAAQVAFADLDDLLASDPVPPAPLLVAFDRDIDQLGHKGGEQFPRLALELAATVARAVGRLHDAGIEEVHVVTDHGFLLLPPQEVDALGRPQVGVAQALRREARWAALKPDAPVADVLRLPCPLDPGGPVLGFPRGVRTLEAAESYMHGGLSLQECVLPHLVSRALVPEEPLGVDVRAATEDLTAGTIPILLAPSGGATSLWSARRPVTVRVLVEVADGPLAGETVAGPIEVEVPPDAGKLRAVLFLREGLSAPLSPGQALRLRAVDRETGREVAAQPLTLRVPWE